MEPFIVSYWPDLRLNFRDSSPHCSEQLDWSRGLDKSASLLAHSNLGSWFSSLPSCSDESLARYESTDSNWCVVVESSREVLSQSKFSERPDQMPLQGLKDWQILLNINNRSRLENCCLTHQFSTRPGRQSQVVDWEPCRSWHINHPSVAKRETIEKLEPAAGYITACQQRHPSIGKENYWSCSSACWRICQMH